MPSRPARPATLCVAGLSANLGTSASAPTARASGQVVQKPPDTKFFSKSTRSIPPDPFRRIPGIRRRP
ncbi:hypothetical protein F8B43_2784 [Methylorubrum populi]|uniref:Uncharacterized protein n=1 Tax=Methylorubrum populi TaxID=223967 RepID=A0A833MYW4_9HYPH|nr:hypothetical protein F8B43_2784 [Methylorubrum populi]